MHDGYAVIFRNYIYNYTQLDLSPPVLKDTSLYKLFFVNFVFKLRPLAYRHDNHDPVVSHRE